MEVILHGVLSTNVQNHVEEECKQEHDYVQIRLPNMVESRAPDPL